jgi:membrane associated rhomboid family serine protease
MDRLVIAASPAFSTSHIALTAALSGAIAAIIAAALLRGERRLLDTLAIGLLTAGAVFMLRKSANMPQLNNDGLEGFSANDWLAPTVTFVVLGLYGAFRPPAEPRRFEQARAAATVVAFAINVVTI